MRVAEHVLLEQLGVPADLGVGVEAAAGVVEVGVLRGVETAVFGRAEVVEHAGPGVLRMRLEEARVCRALASLIRSFDGHLPANITKMRVIQQRTRGARPVA